MDSWIKDENSFLGQLKVHLNRKEASYVISQIVLHFEFDLEDLKEFEFL
jgi:hypothetical protein